VSTPTSRGAKKRAENRVGVVRANHAVVASLDAEDARPVRTDWKRFELRRSQGGGAMLMSQNLPLIHVHFVEASCGS